MQMVSQYDDCLDRKQVSFAYVAKCRPQRGDVVRQQGSAAVGQVDGEEIASAGNGIAPVVRGFAALNPSYTSFPGTPFLDRRKFLLY